MAVESLFAPLEGESQERFNEARNAIVDQCNRIPIEIGGGQLRILDRAEAADAIRIATTLILDYVDTTINSIDGVLTSDEFDAILAGDQRSRVPLVRSLAARKIRLDASSTAWPGAALDPVHAVLNAFDRAGRLDDPAVIHLVGAISRARGPELDSRSRELFEVSVESTGITILAAARIDRRSPEAVSARRSAWLNAGKAERNWVVTSGRVMDELVGLIVDDPLADIIASDWRRMRSPASMAGEDGIDGRLAELQASLAPGSEIREQVEVLRSIAKDSLGRMIAREYRWREERSREYARKATSLDAYRSEMWSLRKQRVDTVVDQLWLLHDSDFDSDQVRPALEWSTELRAALDQESSLGDWPSP